LLLEVENKTGAQIALAYLHTENVLVVPVLFAVATATVMLLRLTESVLITFRTDEWPTYIDQR